VGVVSHSAYDTQTKDTSYLEISSVGIVTGYLGDLAHGVDAHDTLESQIGLESQPTCKVIRRNCSQN
jgi:hypothetical protein